MSELTPKINALSRPVLLRTSLEEGRQPTSCSGRGTVPGFSRKRNEKHPEGRSRYFPHPRNSASKDMKVDQKESKGNLNETKISQEKRTDT